LIAPQPELAASLQLVLAPQGAVLAAVLLALARLETAVHLALARLKKAAQHPASEQMVAQQF